MKDWENYEDQIFEKLRTSFPNSDIRKNQKIIGRYSERSRQIDILVKATVMNREVLIIIDCKKFSKKIDVKGVESYIGFSEDVGAHIGIMITNVGYTKSAEKRAKNHHKDIQLDIVEFENFEDYDFSFDSCSLCKDDDDFPRGFIRWNDPLPIVRDGLITLINQGECSYCGELHVRCQDCGDIIDFNEQDQVECCCENIFEIKSEYIGNGMTEEYIVLSKGKIEPPEFKDPNQTNLFE